MPLLEETSTADGNTVGWTNTGKAFLGVKKGKHHTEHFCKYWHETFPINQNAVYFPKQYSKICPQHALATEKIYLVSLLHSWELQQKKKVSKQHFSQIFSAFPTNHVDWRGIRCKQRSAIRKLVHRSRTKVKSSPQDQTGSSFSAGFVKLCSPFMNEWKFSVKIQALASRDVAWCIGKIGTKL